MNRLAPAVTLATIAVASLGLTGCQYRSKSDKYVLVAPNLKLAYWKTVYDGFQAAAADYGVSVNEVGPDSYDPQAEATAFRNAAAQKPAGILVSVAETGLLTAEINAAVSAGIPVITVDSDAPASSRLFFIGTNNLEAGRLGGHELVEKLNGKGNVVFYTITGQHNLDERLKGYKDVLAASPNIKVVDVVSTNSDINNTFDKTDVFLGLDGANKIDAFVSLESTSGDAIAQDLKRKSITGRTVIAMDIGADTLSYINDGTVDATISQKPWTMGYLGLQALDSTHHVKSKDFRTSYAADPHAPFPSFIDTGSALITKYNANLYQQNAAK